VRKIEVLTIISILIAIAPVIAAIGIYGLLKKNSPIFAIIALLMIAYSMGFLYVLISQPVINPAIIEYLTGKFIALGIIFVAVVVMMIAIIFRRGK
jgi:NADH:ubiquinone oxidoreductase subunit K